MADRLKVTTTLVREYEWDGKPFDELSRDELLEAVKDLARRTVRPADVMSFPQYQALARGAVPGPVVVADAYAHQRQPGYKAG